MKIVTLRLNPKSPNEIEVHVEIWTTICAVIQATLWYGAFILLGMAIHRNYVHWTGY